MKNVQRKFLGLTLALVVCATFAWDFLPLPDAQARLAALPQTGPNFTSRELPLTPGEAVIFGKARVMKRLYQVESRRFVVTVIDGTLNRHAVHDPLYCFRGAGWTVQRESSFAVPNGEARWLDLTKGAEEREALDWFTDGAQRYVSPLRYWWQTTLRRLTLSRSGEEPVLVILQPVDESSLDWRALTKSFPALFDF